MEIEEDINTIVERAKLGDQKAYNFLMQKYYNAVIYLIERIVKQHEDAEDLMLITFSKAFNNLSSYQSSYAFSTWLFKIASNTAIDFLRKKNNTNQRLNSDRHVSIDIVENSKSNILNPFEELERAQKIEGIKYLIQKLSEEDQLIVNLRYHKEKSYEEISYLLNMPVGTIKTRLFRIRKQLLVWIKKNNDSI